MQRKNDKADLIIPSLGLFVSAILFLIGNTGKYFGASVNLVLSCNQDITDSSPCYVQYDVFLMCTSLFLGSVFLGIIMSRIYMSIKKNR
jgi:hypothetical protein